MSRLTPGWPVPAWAGYLIASAVGRIVGDVVVTWPEVEGLMAGLLHVDAPPAGGTRFTDWAREHADGLGRRYASEMARRRDRRLGYR